MAGDWIKCTKGLARKPEVLQAAVALNRTRHEVAALFMEVWEWADDNAVLDLSGSQPDTRGGDVPGVVRLGSDPAAVMDRMFGVIGLAAAMVAVGWLEVRGEDLLFPRFDRHNTNTAN